MGSFSGERPERITSWIVVVCCTRATGEALAPLVIAPGWSVGGGDGFARAPDEEGFESTSGKHAYHRRASLTGRVYHQQRCKNLTRAAKVMFKRFDTYSEPLRHLTRLNMLVDTEETPESALEREDILHTGEGGRLSLYPRRSFWTTLACARSCLKNRRDKPLVRRPRWTRSSLLASVPR
jgi:hypothetical protein